MDSHTSKSGWCGITRRGFLAGMATGAAVGAPLGWYALKGQHLWNPNRFTGQTHEVENPEYGMPGPYPGRVVEIRNRNAVDSGYQIDNNSVKTMMAQGMKNLTGADHPLEAWSRLFARDDVIGIKVNPVGMQRGSRIASISSPEVLIEIVNNLKYIGVPPANIIVFERYANEFRRAGYEAVMRTRPMDGIRWYACSSRYSNTQVAIDGHDNTRERDPHVIGYDPDVYVSMGFASNHHDRRDDRRYRSHLSAIVTRLVNKIITIPCLKDHRSAGVTLALKNMSHGMNNNVARSHIAGIYNLTGEQTGPNQCNTFIPTAVAQDMLRQKSTLHIMDGLIGVYEGGPGAWNRHWGVWPRRSLFFATDPVAMDHVCWDIIDRKRRLEGWLPVSQMGLLNNQPARQCSPRMAALALATPEATMAGILEHQRQINTNAGEPFDRRQPEHILLAGMLGLGLWKEEDIEHSVQWVQ